MSNKTLDNWKQYLREEKKKPTHKGAGFIIHSPDKDSILLIRRSEGSSQGELTGPGGGAEGEETPIQTAVRETKEEIGMDFEGRGHLAEHHDEKDGKVFTTFLVSKIGEPDCKLNHEHDAYGWFDPEEIKEAIERFNGVIVSRKFKDKSNKNIDTKAKIHYNTIKALKSFGLI
tara:strand:- start:3193 stop:3711 length:519 start_codon:yes stop_codon:yes gene_type:complete